MGSDPKDKPAETNFPTDQRAVCIHMGSARPGRIS